MASKFKLSSVVIFVTATLWLSGFIFTQQVEAQQTGGLNLNAYYQRHHGSNARAVNIDGTAYGWRCEVNGMRHSISVDSVCVEQYGSGATSHFRDYNDQNSWYCQIPQQASQPPQQPPSQPQPPAQQPIQQQSQQSQTNSSTTCSTRFHVGVGTAVVLSETNLSVRMRTGPGLNNSEIRQLRSGTNFEITGGPRCADGYVWWEIRHNNRTGWIARTVIATVNIRRIERNVSSYLNSIDFTSPEVSDDAMADIFWGFNQRYTLGLSLPSIWSIVGILVDCGALIPDGLVFLAYLAGSQGNVALAANAAFASSPATMLGVEQCVISFSGTLQEIFR